jgi:hypothetical protein
MVIWVFLKYMYNCIKVILTLSVTFGPFCPVSLALTYAADRQRTKNTK